MLQTNNIKENQSIVFIITNLYESNKNTHKMLQNNKNK